MTKIALIQRSKLADQFDDELNETYDDGFRAGYAEAIRVARAAITSDAYGAGVSRGIRGLLTRLHNDFKKIF